MTGHPVTTSTTTPAMAPTAERVDSAADELAPAGLPVGGGRPGTHAVQGEDEQEQPGATAIPESSTSGSNSPGGRGTCPASRVVAVAGELLQAGQRRVRNEPSVSDRANTSEESTLPSTPATSRTLDTNRRSVPPSAYSLRFSRKTTKSIAPAMSMWVASIGRRSLAWSA